MVNDFLKNMAEKIKQKIEPSFSDDQETSAPVEGIRGNNYGKLDLAKRYGAIASDVLMSIAGVKFFPDAYKYASQKKEIGFGAERLKKSVDNIVNYADSAGVGKKRFDAIKDLNHRLTFVEGGDEKKSKQRNLVARLLREKRKNNQDRNDDFVKRLEEELAAYTRTKTNGMQVAREAMNTILMGTGAFALRPVAYGILDFSKKVLDNNRESRYAKVLNLNIQNPEIFVIRTTIDSIKKAFSDAVQGTWADLVGRDEEKDRFRKELTRAKAIGNIARYAGIAAHGGVDGVLRGIDLQNINYNFNNHLDSFQKMANGVNRFEEISHLSAEVPVSSQGVMGVPFLDNSKPEVPQSGFEKATEEADSFLKDKHLLETVGAQQAKDGSINIPLFGKQLDQVLRRVIVEEMPDGFLQDQKLSLDERARIENVIANLHKKIAVSDNEQAVYLDGGKLVISDYNKFKREISLLYEKTESRNASWWEKSGAADAANRTNNTTWEDMINKKLGHESSGVIIREAFSESVSSLESGYGANHAASNNYELPATNDSTSLAQEPSEPIALSPDIAKISEQSKMLQVAGGDENLASLLTGIERTGKVTPDKIDDFKKIFGENAHVFKTSDGKISVNIMERDIDSSLKTGHRIIIGQDGVVDVQTPVRVGFFGNDWILVKDNFLSKKTLAELLKIIEKKD